MRLEQVLLLDEAGIPLEDGRAHMTTDEVVHRVAHDTGGQQHQQHMAVAHETGTGHDTGGKKQGIPRQEGRDHEAGLAKDDDEQDGIDPHPVLFHQLEEMGVDMQDEVHQICQKFHVHLGRDLD